MFAHQLGDELKIAVSGGDSDINDAVEAALADEFEATAAEIFAEGHAECWRIGGGLGAAREDVGTVEIGMPGDQELMFVPVGV